MLGPIIKAQGADAARLLYPPIISAVLPTRPPPHSVIGVLVSIVTWGALPMTHLQPSQHASSRRHRYVKCRAEYLQEWELVHHSGMPLSMLEDFAEY